MSNIAKFDNIYFTVNLLGKKNFLFTYIFQIFIKNDCYLKDITNIKWWVSVFEAVVFCLCWSIFFFFQMVLDRFEISWLTCYRLISFLFPGQKLELLLLCVLSHCPFYCILISAAVSGWMWASQFFPLIHIITKHWELWSIFVLQNKQKSIWLATKLDYPPVGCSYLQNANPCFKKIH